MITYNRNLREIIFRLKNIVNYFTYYEEDEICFLHIPKTAGTYFAQLESSKIKGVRYLGHTNIEGDKKIDFIEGYPKTRIPRRNIKGKIIAIARSPENWLQSYYGHATGLEKRYEDKNHLDYKFKGRIDDLIIDIMSRDDKWPNKHGNYSKYLDSDGNFLPDILLFQECLDEGMKVLEDMGLIPKIKRSVQRKSSKTEYLSPASRQLIKKNWKLDYDIFKYEDNVSPYYESTRGHGPNTQNKKKCSKEVQ
ncbi:hypothetical protein BZG13_13900 [Salinivibrio sp. ML323]|uniref:hypothetical protein n=1 Tax=Salinivibrio sp. ML323 TaxID=1909474 RepID=UPI0009877674|nr:hypothetical protein [Salinivibrio sp. ML323]OOE56687.1 hypothetical protein BZG13_13900 [Salinivibrio sp. ML323]